MRFRPSTLIATVFHVGYARQAPGTWGSFAGILLAWPILAMGGVLELFASAFVLFFFGWWAADQYERNTGRHDPQEVVVDEVVGQWLTLSLGALLAIGARLLATHAADPSTSYLQAFLDILFMTDESIRLCLSDLLRGRVDYDTGLLAGYTLLAFGLFRLFDIWKPLHIGRVDRAVQGGLGTMLDDALAGLVAAFGMAATAILIYRLFFAGMTE